MIRLMKPRTVLPPILLLASLAIAVPASDLAFGSWTRASNEPIISPQGATWESGGTFNPAVITVPTVPIAYAMQPGGKQLKFGKIVMLYRAQDTSGTSRLGYAESSDGIHFIRRAEPVLAPEADYEIDGKYWMYWLGTAVDKTDQMGLSYSTDLIHWTEATQTPVLPRRPGKFDSRVVEPGPPPILTPAGIVLVYNGADDKLVYRTGVAVFDRADPRMVLSRTDEPIFAPEKEWEKVGQVPNVVFVEGMAREGNRWLFYYGGADKCVGVAEAPAR